MVIVKLRKGQLLKSQLVSKTVDTLLHHTNHQFETVNVEKGGCGGTVIKQMTKTFSVESAL